MRVPWATLYLDPVLPSRPVHVVELPLQQQVMTFCGRLKACALSLCEKYEQRQLHVQHAQNQNQMKMKPEYPTPSTVGYSLLGSCAAFTAGARGGIVW